MNPFPTIGYHGSEYFCDREDETKILCSSIENNRAVNLTSIRRIGKTALIKHVFGQLDNVYVPIFIDLEGTDNISAFISRFTHEIGKKLAKIDRGIIQKILKWASGIGASISLDPIDGLPRLDFSYNQKIKIESLDGLFQLMNHHSKRVFILAIDEFQEITKYPESTVEGWIRFKMQEFPNIRFIFSGSEQSLMQHIFNDPSQPFYQITHPMHLGYIPQEKYFHFIKNHFSAFSQITEANISEILDWCRGHTYYVQYFCNVIYGKLMVNEYTSLEEVKWEILETNKHFFLTQKKLVTEVHWKLLKAIAKENMVKNITAKDFAQKSGLATTSIKRSAESLLDKSLLLSEEDGVKVYNVFFHQYLKSQL